MKDPKPSDLELKVLSLLWERGPLTAREVLESLPDKKKRAYTSVLSVMQVMEKKGLLDRTREGLTDRWRPTVNKDEILGPLMERMVSHLFAGRASSVLQQLLQRTPVDRDELQSIKKLIEDYEQQLPGKKDGSDDRRS